ncbi:MAG: hypothetical protein JXR71_04465 [Bacteroidales bacterium]|nr:hypothetical protein [Bacteroidales bacterium]
MNNQNTDRIEIPVSKSKLLGLLVGAAVFFVVGIFLYITPESFVSVQFKDTQTMMLMGIAGILFSGVTLIFGIRKLLNKKPGLIIDQQGITDNTTASSAGLIEWNDITAIETKKVLTNRFMLIRVSNPDYYLNRVNGLKQKILRENLDLYETPISITTSTLKCTFQELEKLLNEKFNENRIK